MLDGGEFGGLCSSLAPQEAQQLQSIAGPNQPLLAMKVLGDMASFRAPMAAFTSAATKAIMFIFEEGIGKTTANLALGGPEEDCTCCVIKPHVVKEKNVGKILDDIHRASFAMSAVQMFEMERGQAEEFMEVYKGVVPNFKQMVDEMTSGHCVGICINGFARGGDVVSEFRKLVGPFEFAFAKKLRPDSLRAKYGSSGQSAPPPTPPAAHTADRPRPAAHCFACNAPAGWGQRTVGGRGGGVSTARSPVAGRACGRRAPSRALSLAACHALCAAQKNAVHCTDLPGDGQLDCEYLFSIMQ